jgi:hypothetical protein
MHITPARRGLCFIPTEQRWKLLLRQEESIDRQLERKMRLLWAMQEEDRKRRGDEAWQEIIRQEAEAAEAGEAEARAQEAEQARLIEEAAAQIGEHFKKIQEQSRQAAENKSPGSEAQGPGGAEESETGEATLPGDGPRPNEETSNPVVRPNQPPEALQEP